MSHTVSAGITVLSYRPFVYDQEQGLIDVWESNATLMVYNELHSQNIDPSSISDAEFTARVKKSMAENPQSDLRLLLNRVPDLEWSAPRQNLLDGVLYFYLGDTRPKNNTSACLKEAQQRKMSPIAIEAIRQDRIFVHANARHIIGMARVTSKATSGGGVGFGGRNFVTVDTANFHVFEHPLSYDFMIDNGQPTYGSTVISIPGPLQEAYRTELLKKNTNLPSWYTSMKFGDAHIPYIHKGNWLKEVPNIDNFELSPTDTSNPEYKVCYYFINHLVYALQDPDLPDQLQYLEQVTSMRNGQSTGKPDYMLRMHDVWVPLEAKVAVNTEVRIRDQVQQYINIDAFHHREGRTRITTPMRPHGVCLVADQYGIYLTHNGEFIDCTPDRPRWDRRQLTRKVIKEIRDTVATYL